MSTALIPLLIASSLFTTTIESALASFESKDFATAAALLDESAAVEPGLFRINNLHYVRGRVAEHQQDWERARQEFRQIAESSLLFGLSLWHRILGAVRTGDMDDAGMLLDRLPSNFPANLRLELALEAPDDFALRIYDSIQTREAQWRRALIRGDEASMWRLLSRQRTDDVALEAARRLAGRGGTSEQRLRLAKTFYAHRLFEQAGAVYFTLLENASVGDEAHYELGRTFFQQTRYGAAIRIYRLTIARFPDTDWERDAEYQIASCYWRMENFPAAAETYLEIIEKETERDRYHSAVRNLVDVYRVLGQTTEALSWIDLALERRPSTANRQVLLFTKAKLHYTNGRYEDAHTLFRQLEQMQLRTAPNGTGLAEVRYFRALSLDRLGRMAEARGIWRDLASEPFTYYGQRSSERLGAEAGEAVLLNRTLLEAGRTSSMDLCRRASDQTVIETIRKRRLSRTRDFRAESSPETDMVGELVFLRQWDEAFYWANRVASRWKDIALADLAYLASELKSSMFYADRLRPVEDMELFSLDANYTEEGLALLGMLYPSAFNASICKESALAGVSPLWLQAIIWQESRYDPDARSGASARGLMQFIPETAAEMARELGMGDLELDTLYDPTVSVRFGAHYWSQLMEELGHPALALAAYNGGIQNVRRWKAKSGTDDVDLFVSDIGFVQTKDYVMKVFALYAKYAHLR
jgi:soluble lytic murein transglycosylase